MSRSIQIALVAVCAAFAVASPQAGTTLARPDTTLCKQIPGPYAAYLSLVSGFRSKGTTWTVLATKHLTCAFAVAQASALLRKWRSAAIGARLSLPGFACVKMRDRAYSGPGVSSGGFLCHRGGVPAPSPFAPDTFAVRETNPYTPEQIRALFGIR